MDITFEKQGRIGLVTINRPDKMNAITFQMVDDLKAMFGQIRKDMDIHVVVITGAGEKAFCVGQDLNEFRSFLEAENNVLKKSFWDTTSYDSILTDDTFNKPVIAAINGHCLGYGLTLALSSDLRISSDQSTFGFPEVKIGIPTVIGAIKIPRTIALGPAMELLLTGDAINAQEAYRMNLINRVVEPSNVMKTAMELADKIARHNPVAVKATKEIAIRGLGLPFSEIWRMGESFRVLSFDFDEVKARFNEYLQRKE